MDKHAFNYKGLTVTRDWETKDLQLFAYAGGEEICVNLDEYSVQNLHEALKQNALYRHGEDAYTLITLFPTSSFLGGRILHLGKFAVLLPHERVNSLLGLTKATRNLGWKIPLKGVEDLDIQEEKEEGCKRQFFVQIHPKEPANLKCVSITYTFPSDLKLSTSKEGHLVTLAFPPVMKTIKEKLLSSPSIDWEKYGIEQIEGRIVHFFASLHDRRKILLENNSLTFLFQHFSSEEYIGFKNLKKESLEVLKVLLEDLDIVEIRQITTTKHFSKSIPPIEDSLKEVTTESVFLKDGINTKVKVQVGNGVYSLKVSSVSTSSITVDNFISLGQSLDTLNTTTNHFIFKEEAVDDAE